MPTPSPGYHPGDNKAVKWWWVRHLLWPVLEGHENRLRILEDHMALTDDALVELSSAIDEVAGELDQLEAQVGESDAEAAGKIRAAAERLRNLRPDTPADGGPVAEPAPDQPAPVDDGPDAA